MLANRFHRFQEQSVFYPFAYRVNDMSVRLGRGCLHVLLLLGDELLEAADLDKEHDGGGDGGERVAHRKAPPHTLQRVGGEEQRQQQRQRDEVQHLPRQAQEDGVLRPADTREEVNRNHLKTNPQHAGADDTHRADGLLYQRGVVREDTHHEMGQTLAQEKERGGGDGAQERGEEERTQHPPILLRTVVVAHYRLHTLVEPHHNRRKDKHHAVNHPVGRYCHIAPVATELVVDDNHHEATRQIGQERRQAHRQRLPRDMLIQPPDAAVDMYQLLGIQKDSELPHHRHCLRKHGRQRGAAHTHIQAEDEDRVKHDVQPHRHYRSRHRPFGVPHRAQDIIQPVVDMREDIAVEDYLHIIARVRQRLLARAERH